MNNKLSNFVNSTKMYISKHSPEILTGIGITGMITSTILAVRATPKALDLIAYKKEELNTDELTIKETISVCWKPYLPAVVSCISGASCLIGACTINVKRNAALATAYTLTEKTLTTYRDKVVKTIGEKKEKEIRDAIAQDEVNKDQETTRQVIITPKGQTLCKDSISGRYFRSDLDTIRKVINELNRKMTYENYISLNEYYSCLGLDRIKDGDYLGWNIDKGLIELDFDACITDTDEPCIVIDYSIVPYKGYDR